MGFYGPRRLARANLGDGEHRLFAGGFGSSHHLRSGDGWFKTGSRFRLRRSGARGRPVFGNRLHGLGHDLRDIHLFFSGGSSRLRLDGAGAGNFRLWSRRGHFGNRSFDWRGSGLNNRRSRGFHRFRHEQLGLRLGSIGFRLAGAGGLGGGGLGLRSLASARLGNFSGSRSFFRDRHGFEGCVFVRIVHSKLGWLKKGSFIGACTEKTCEGDRAT